MANPPVCRIMDYGKFRYEEAQKAKESRKKSMNVSVKEVKFKPKIGRGDSNTTSQATRPLFSCGVRQADPGGRRHPDQRSVDANGLGADRGGRRRALMEVEHHAVRLPAPALEAVLREDSGFVVGSVRLLYCPA